MNVNIHVNINANVNVNGNENINVNLNVIIDMNVNANVNVTFSVKFFDNNLFIRFSFVSTSIFSPFNSSEGTYSSSEAFSLSNSSVLKMSK